MPARQGAASTGDTFGTTITFSHTHPVALTNDIIVVTVHFKHNDPATQVNSVTYAGQALTFLASVTNANRARTEKWYRVNPATGANNVVVTLNGVNTDGAIAGARSFDDTDQSSPFGTVASATGLSTAPSVLVTATAPDLVIDAVTSLEGTLTVDASQTQDYNNSKGDIRGAASFEAAGAPATVSMDWTITPVARHWAICGVALKAPAAPPVVGSQELNPGSVNVAGIATIV